MSVRRRALLAAPPLLALLAACRTGTDAEAGSDGAAAGSPAARVEDPTPRTRGELAGLVGPEELLLPLELTPMIVVDPGWTAAPQQLDGILAGFREQDDRLLFLVVDQDGTILWEADRPLSCTGFALTRGADDRPVAVLADLAPAEDALGAMTLTGYDLRTADRLWGPVAAPGPQVAPGLVLAEPSAEPMGAGGPRTAHSGADGSVAAAEDDGSDARILAEHLGTILRSDGRRLIASAADGTSLWTHDLTVALDAASMHVVGPIDAVTPYAVVSGTSTAESADATGIVIDLRDGAEIAVGAEAVAQERMLDITVIAAGSTIRGLDADGVEQWRHEDEERLTLLSAGERLAYAVREDEGTLVVLDTGRGLMVQPYDVDSTAPLAVPELFTADTAVVVLAGTRRCLVTTVLDESYGTRG
ncbi:hypothetical protein ACXET9_06290 [Brachybacterium sp. DNPG3]